MKANFRRLFSLLLVLAMLVSMIPAVMAESEATEVDSSDAFCEALAAGGTIKLAADITLSAAATVPAGVTVVLDLNGKTISSTNEAYHIANAGTLTIIDSREGDKDGEIKMTPASESAAVSALKNTGTLTINGGKITTTTKSKTAQAISSESSSVTINGGTFEANYNATGGSSAYTVVLLGDTSGASVATINGGSFIAKSKSTGNSRCAAIFANCDNTKKITITINGGTFEGIRDGYRGASAIRFRDTACGATVVINDGTFRAGKTAAGATDDRMFAGSLGALTIKGGTFTYDTLIFTDARKATITGGTFVKWDGTKNDISSYVTGAGYTQNEQGIVALGVDSSEAFVAAMAKGGSIRLTGDIALAAVASVPAGKTVILDLNGKTLSSTNEANRIENEGNLTIMDSRDGDKDGQITMTPASESTTVYGLKNTGTLTINGGKITATTKSKTVYTVYSESSSVTINGGTIEANYNSTGSGSAYGIGLLGDTSGASVATINGGTFIATSKSTANSRCAAIFANCDNTKKITITINGGTFEGSRDGYRGASAIRFRDTQCGATVVINDGTFRAGKTAAGATDDRMFAGTLGALTIKGGTFTYDTKIFTDARKATITGGTFVKWDGTKNDISSYVSKGYVQNEEGAVVDAPDQVVIGTTGYKTLELALESSQAGDTIALQTDVQLTDSLTLAEGVTLDLNGKSLETTAVFGDGQILDSQQSGLLKVEKDKVIFAPNNAHLPVYDAAAGGYRMAQVQFQTKSAATTGVFYFRFDLTNVEWEKLLPENDIALLVRVAGVDTTYAAPQQWLDALYNDTTGRGAIKVTFLGWDNTIHNLTVSVTNNDTPVEVSQGVDNNEALYPNADGVREIWTVRGLQVMAQNATKGYSYKLMADIDMGGADWTSVPSFKGTFDGNGKTISNFTISKPAGTNMGFFATTAKEVDGNRTVIRNLHLDVNIVVDGVDDAVNDNSTVRFVGAIVGENFGDVEGCSSVCIVTDMRQLADLKRTYYGTLVGNNAERTLQNDDGTSQKIPLGVISGTNAMETTVNITESSEDFRNPGTKVNSKMALLLSDSVDYTTKTAKTAVGIAGNSNRQGIDQKLVWQDLTNSTDLAGQAVQERRETAAARMYELCTVEWKPTETMYNYNNYSTVDGWSVETKVSAAEQGLLTTDKGIQRGLAYAHSTPNLERFNALVGHYTGELEQWDSKAFFYNTSDSLHDFGREAYYDQSGWGLQIGSDCIGQVASAWRAVSAVEKNTSGSVRLVGTADTYPSTKYMNWYGFQPVNDLIFEEPGDLDGNGTADQNSDRHLYVADYYKNNPTHFLDSLAMTSKADVLIGYSKSGNGHAIMAISDAVVIRKWNGTVDTKLSYIVTAEQGGTGTDSDGIDRYSKVTKNGIYKTIEWSSTCCVDRRTTFADLVLDGNGAGKTSWQFFPVTCDVLRNEDSAAANVVITMDAAGQVNSTFNIISTTVNGETIFTGMQETLKSYRGSTAALNLATVHSTAQAGATVTVQLANGEIYTGTIGTAGLTKAN